MTEPEWDDDYDEDDEHDRFHPWMFAGCEECSERADRLERLYQDRLRTAHAEPSP
jgi:hypothetical protein